MSKITDARDTGASSETGELVKSQPVGRVDKEFKRAQFLALKEANDQGRLIPPDRRGFSPKVRKAVFDAYDGLCARCDEPLRPGFHIDHILERDLGGTMDLKNLVPLHPECHRPKTSERAPVLAKVHRLEKQTFGEPKEPKGRKFQPRPFPTVLRKKMNGQVVRREKTA